MRRPRRSTNSEAETKVLKKIRDTIATKPPRHIVVIVLIVAAAFGGLTGALRQVADEARHKPTPTSTTVQQFIGVPQPGETVHVPQPGPTVTVTKPGGVTRQEVMPSKTTQPTETKRLGASDGPQ